MSAQAAFSQTGKPKDQQLVALADEVYRNSGARRQALEQYRQALEVNPDNLKANYMAGICYLQTIQKERSLAHFLRVQDLDPNYESGMNIGADLYPDLDYLIGMAYHLGENFDRAKVFYKRFAANVRDGKGSRQARENKPLALKTVERRLFECETGKQMMSYPVSVRILPLQGPNSDYPDYAPTLDREESRIIFTSRRPGGMAPQVDNDLFYFEDIYISDRQGDSAWSPARLLEGVNTENHEATVTSSADGKSLILYRDANGGDLYLSRNRDGKWSKPKPIGGEVNSAFRESSAFISPDGKKLYFSSDRPGGFGGTDIYVSEALDGENKWGVPSNLGAVVNTEYDDESPVFSIDGVYMFFSSKGHRGMGGYDIFRTRYDSVTHEWVKPENMGYPINTSDNDLYYVQGNDIGHAYFASSRESGTGDMDLYLIRPVNKDDSLLIRGPKLDDLAKQAQALSDDKANLLSDTSAEGRAFRDAANHFADTSQNALADEFARRGSDSSQSALADEFASMQGNKSGKFTTLKLRLSVIDKATRRLLDASMKFVDAETGETFEVKRTKTGTYLVVVPTDKDRTFAVTAERQGYQFRNATLKVKAGDKGTKVFERLIEMERIGLNKPRVLKNLYFDFDKVNLRPASLRELALLENLMRENPRLIVEVAGHTDDVGTDEYNQRLSERRAKAVVNHLVSRGIDRSRLRAKGYGKRIPIATNDDEKDGRELNRRTEFEIIGGRTQ